MSHLYKALLDDYEVEFINFSLLYPSLLFPGATQFDRSTEHFERVPSKRLINSLNPISWWQTARYLNRLNPDLIAIDWYQPYFGPTYYGITTLLKPELRRRLLFICENLVSHEGRSVDRLLTGLGLRHARRFLTLSERVAEEVRAMFGTQAPIYRSELPTFGWYRREDHFDAGAAKQELGFAPTDRVLLFFGYIRKYKGLDILIDAFAQLHPRHPELKLLVAGEFYDDEGSYREQITRLGLHRQVRIISQFIPNEQVAQYFQLSEVVVMPYRSATQSGILAIAYGYDTPVVITDVGGLRESVDDGRTGIVVDAATPEAIAAGVERFFELQREVDFAQHIRERVAGNAFGKISEVFAEILEEAKR